MLDPTIQELYKSLQEPEKERIDFLVEKIEQKDPKAITELTNVLVEGTPNLRQLF